MTELFFALNRMENLKWHRFNVKHSPALEGDVNDHLGNARAALRTAANVLGLAAETRVA
jgi:hypothetical protein